MPERIELHASLIRANASKAVDIMDLEIGSDGAFRGRTMAVLDGDAVRWLVHRIEEVSDIVRANDRVGQELEAFRYSVAHDLRFPLRVVDGYARALEEDCAALLDEQGRGYLSAVRKGVTKMDAMITSLGYLLEVSRASYVESAIDVTALARDATAKLRSREPREVAVDIADGLVAHGDRRLVEHVFEALLGNAWKFTGKQPKPAISVGKEGDAFFVRDNGAGFDGQAARLFAPFRRLHKAEEYPGEGVGLAIVYRAITRHGGRVWAESAPGKGATLFFTLR